MHGLATIVYGLGKEGGNMKISKNQMQHKLDIQFFAEEENNKENVKENVQETKKVSFDELLSDKEYKSEFDRKVNSAIEAYKENLKKKSTASVEQVTESGQDEKISTVEVTNETNPFKEKYLEAEIKWALTQAGVEPGKAARAIRLIDSVNLLNQEGALVEEVLTKAIDDLLKEWPELKTNTENNGAEFKIGSNNSKDNEAKTDDLIAKAFGN